MTSDYLFVRLLLLAGAVMGGLVVLIVIVLMLGTGSGSPLAFTLHCSLSSTTSFDAIVHAIALACGLVAIAPLVSGLRAAAQARAGIAQLRQAAPIANHGMSPRVIHAAVATGLTDRVEVVDLARPLAFTYGWLQPRVCLSTALIERLVDDELEAVLYHEAWHVLRRDPLRLIVVKLFNDAFFFVPDLARLAHLHSLTVEIAADRHVVVQMGHSRALAKALLKTLGGTAPAPAFGGHLSARVEAMSHGTPALPRGRGRIALAAILVEIAIFMALLGNGTIPSMMRFLGHPVC